MVLRLVCGIVEPFKLLAILSDLILCDLNDFSQRRSLGILGVFFFLLQLRVGQRFTELMELMRVL